MPRLLAPVSKSYPPYCSLSQFNDTSYPGDCASLQPNASTTNLLKWRVLQFEEIPHLTNTRKIHPPLKPQADTASLVAWQRNDVTPLVL